MAFDVLSEADRDGIRRTVLAAVHGPFFDDGEFPTLFGVSREQAIAVLARWPAINDREEAVFLTINNAFANLIHYPHGRSALVESLTALTIYELKALLIRWRADGPDPIPDDYLETRHPLDT